MFWHIFKNRFKCLTRDKITIFWTLMFPIVLALLFHLTLSNIGGSEIFQPINIAVVDNYHYKNNENFKKVLNDASTGEDRLFNLTVTSKEEADILLENKDVEGYIEMDPQISLIVKKSGLTQSIIKNFLDNYLQTFSAVETILSENPAKQQELFEALGNYRTYIKEVPPAKAKLDVSLNFFYSLIAMACLYGCFFGLREITDIQADISPLAARINASPVHKLKAFLSSSFASLVIHIIEIGAFLAFLVFVLKIDFGENTGFVILTSLTGSITGVSYGAFISALVKKSENVKVAILISTIMTWSFLAGMMHPDMKYVITKHVPFLSWINPVNLLADSYFSLYFYDNLSKYAMNTIVLFLFAVLFCSGTYFIVRRRKYASL
ncbi:MAG: ABC transporter permease [Clostridiaceae bacterium]|nr:ABC transporter permease [Clostridiaceae bacterium]